MSECSGLTGRLATGNRSAIAHIAEHWVVEPQCGQFCEEFVEEGERTHSEPIASELPISEVWDTNKHAIKKNSVDTEVAAGRKY